LTGEGRHDGKFQYAADTALCHQFERVALDALQTFSDLRGVVTSVRRQYDTLLDAQEQRHPEAMLERGDLPAHGALRERQFVGGSREAFVPCRCLENLQRGEIRDAFSHR